MEPYTYEQSLGGDHFRLFTLDAGDASDYLQGSLQTLHRGKTILTTLA